MPDVPSTLHLSTRLSLEDDAAALEYILSDVPFFSVGLLAFGMFTFLLAMKRVNFLSVYLYLAALLGFSAAILDLGQILTRAHSRGVDTGNAGIVTARELALAASVGFRFFFYWALVGSCPRSEIPSSEEPSSARPHSEHRDTIHSASWERWGLLGHVLKWTLLVLVILVPILQIVWRIDNQSRPEKAVYVTEAALETVLSVFFILKLLSNIILSPRRPLWLPVLSSSAPIVALGFSAGVSIGNITASLFSETALGRFLQALELYILILYLLINSFYVGSFKSNKISSIGWSSETAPGLSPVTSKMADLPPLPPPPIPQSPQPAGDGSAMPSRASSLTRSRYSLRRPASGEQQLWNDAELTGADGDGADSYGASPEPLGPRIEEFQAVAINVPMAQDFGQRTSPTQQLFKQDLASPRRRTLLGPRRPRAASSSIPSYYLNDASAVVPPRSLPAPGGSDSPIFGLNNTIYTPTQRTSVEAPRSSTASFNELLRRQTELDKSIAALRLFSSGSASNFPGPPSTTLAQRGKDSPGSTSAVSNNSRKPASGSAYSEFSLSIFPEPPDDKFSVPPTPAPQSRRATLRSQRFGWNRGSVLPVAVHPLDVSVEVTPSNARSSARANAIPSYGSAGTQYDVTSFIGDLMEPPSGILTATVDGLSGTSAEAPQTDVMPTISGALQREHSKAKPPTSSQPSVSAKIFDEDLPRSRVGLPPHPRPTMINGPRPLPQDGGARNRNKADGS